MPPLTPPSCGLLLGLLLVFGCSGTESLGEPRAGAGTNAIAGTSSAGTSSGGAGAGSGGAPTGSGGLQLISGGTTGGDTTTPEPECEGDQALTALIRDFRGYAISDEEPRHPDFEGEFTGLKGLVQPTLGADGTPSYAPSAGTVATTGPLEFAQWYHDVANVNQRFEVQLPLQEDATRPGVFVYDNQDFFPIDGQGFDDGFGAHNFHFTTELHFDFSYAGGETFLFRGDDDVWVFINGHLVIDLGGVHPADEASVSLDQQAASLGIKPGAKYRMDIFQAERHTDFSTFRIETSLRCIKNVVVK
jgi:fibro-slime domain-containing protein